MAIARTSSIVSANSNVIQTEDFAALTGTSAAGGTVAWGLEKVLWFYDLFGRDDGRHRRLEVHRHHRHKLTAVENQVNEWILANEEVQSTNEELQSTNEELETTKEEIQSSNEELATVNDELNNRNAELDRIVLRLLSKAPADRYAGAEDLVLDLRDFLNRAA